MGIENNYKLMDFLSTSGGLEILKKGMDRKPKHFENFRSILNHKTNRKFSPSTISLRLKQLIKLGALKRTITETKTGREVVGYIITKKGIQIIKFFDKSEEELNLILVSEDKQIDFQKN
ncbi:MAG: hypothetical protein KKG75_01185 [Nanoarchaeota archaeon]|nr:hypothetical protein [Nanoarchaeota archaeon]